MTSTTDGGQWCLIESDPGVFTELIRGFGCTGVQVEELYSLDESTFSPLRPVYGLIFLFKWRPAEVPPGPVVRDERLEKIFFAQQVIQNACATQAIINLLLNCDSPDVTLGDTLNDFRNFTDGFDPANRGLCISNSDTFRTVHNSFARPHLYDADQPPNRASDADDNYHFITYVPISGHVYELDGLLEGPVDLGTVPENGDWLKLATPVIQQRINRYSEGEIHFNLMALIGDRQMQLERQLNALVQSGASEAAMAEIKSQLADEQQKRISWKADNIRRRHNYVPFIVELLRCLARDNKLVPLVQKAQEKVRSKSEQKQQNA